MEEFKEGDVVVLKSGGPKMTVYGIGNEAVYVTWFSGNELYKKELKQVLLTKIKIEV